MAFDKDLKVNIIGDSSKLKGALEGASSQVTKFAEKIGKIGKTMTIVGAAVTAISVGLIKMASDAEETGSKFAVVFQDVADDASKAAKNLAENFGLSSVAAKQLLGDTGDLLSGFGFTGEAALDLSTKVNELAVDLASFTNYSGGAEGASAALTKALLGERESVKSLGISIMETDVQAKVFELTQKGITFETERQAKAYATLLIAQEQSKNAIGDFSRTSDSFANQMRTLKARVSDVGVMLGEILLPAATKLISSTVKIVERIKEWTEANRPLVDMIVKVTATLGVLAAVGGPIFLAASAFLRAKTAIDSVTFALKLLNIKIATLGTISSGPIGLLILAVGGLYLAWEKNLFGMRDITEEVFASIKGNFVGLQNTLGGGGGAVGVFIEEVGGLTEGMNTLGEKTDEASTAIETFDEWIKKLKEEAAKLADVIKDVNDRIYELSHTAIENATKKIEEQKQTYLDLGVSIEKVDEWYALEIEKLNKANQIKDEAIESNIELKDSYVELEKPIKEVAKITEEATEATKNLGILGGESFEGFTTQIKHATTALSNFTKEGVAAAIANIKMHFKPMINDLINDANRATGIFKQIAEANLARIRKTMNDQIDVIKYGLNVYNNAMSQMGSGGGGGSMMPSYQHGTPYVPKTGLALVHQGEKITPPGQNTTNQSYSPIININNPIVRNDDDIAEIERVVQNVLDKQNRQYFRQGKEILLGA